MKKDDLGNLNELWQKESSRKEIDLLDLERRDKRQKYILFVNVCIEVIAVLLTTILMLWVYLNPASPQVKYWVTFMTVWGWALFIPMNISRWQSLRILRTKSVSEATGDQVRLVGQEIKRWKMSSYATAVVFIGLAYWEIYDVFWAEEAHSWNMLTSFMLFGLAALVYTFYLKWKRLEIVKDNLSG